MNVPSTPNALPEQTDAEYVLFLWQADQPPQAGVNYLHLLLNYRYGLTLQEAHSLPQATSQVQQFRSHIRCVVLFLDQEISRRSLAALNQRGQWPLFLLSPSSQVEQHRVRCQNLWNVFVFSWDDLFQEGTQPSLVQILLRELDRQGAGSLPLEGTTAPEDQQRKVANRLASVRCLPTLPEIVLHLMQLLSDPQTTIEDLEEVLSTDPAIVHRLLRVIHAPVFSGTRSNGQWTLKEVIVRLGLKQVGAIAQQIKLINTLVRPDDSLFDLRRFWEHSVGCAFIADRLYTRRLLPLSAAIDFDHYWIGALLHDIGKLILGFFFWPYFEQILARMLRPETPFHWVETRLDHAVTHEYLGQLLLAQARADQALVNAVATHNNTGRHPAPLVCLIHVADNLCKDLGLGYLPHEKGNYSSSVLATLRLMEEDMDPLKRALGETIVKEIQEVTRRCLSG